MAKIPRGYWGSVLFFKHLFLTALLLLIIVPITIAVSQAFKISGLEARIAELNTAVLKQSLSTSTTNPADDTNTENTPQTQLPLRVEVPAYQYLYPDFTSTAALTNHIELGRKVLYLTFDDGPSQRTVEILDILAEQDFKATFFVAGSQLNTVENQAILQRIADEGHTIGIHTDTHDYDVVYSSVEAFLDDYYALWTKIYEITGIQAEICRLPGGSINNHNRHIYQEIVAELIRRGFLYYDWNASANDALFGDITAEYVVDQATSYNNYERVILLMHDSYNRVATVEALPEIIQYYIEQGFCIEPITNSVAPIAFAYH